MASKEITTYVIDLSQSSSKKSNGRNITDLELGLDYFYDEVVKKIIKNRKTDYISVIAVHSNKTSNPFSTDGSFKNIEVIAQKVVPTYEYLRRFKEVLVPSQDEDEDEEEGTTLDGLLISLGLLKDTEKLKFIRNIVVITNGEENIGSFDTELIRSSAPAINNLSVRVILRGIDFSGDSSHASGKLTPRKLENIANWKTFLSKFDKSEVLNVSKIDDVKLNNSLKTTRPIRKFSARLRFGAGFVSYDRDASKEEMDELSFNVEAYPSIKRATLPSMNEFVFCRKDRSISKVRRVTEYYINKNEDDSDEEHEEGEVNRNNYFGKEDKEKKRNFDTKQKIGSHEWEEGFKFSNYDLIAVDENLEKAANLSCPCGIDILGFVKKDDLPIAYLTEEPCYILPQSDGTFGNAVGFSNFCKALVELNGIILARKVEKDDHEIELCAMLPYIFDVNEGDLMGFISFRLPYREDERVGTFPPLSSIKTTSGKVLSSYDSKISANERPSTLVPSDSANDLMKQFVLNNSLDQPEIKIEEDFNDSRIKNSRLNFSSSSDSGGQSDLNFLSASPAIQKFEFHLRRFIRRSLDSNLDLLDYCMDPEFRSKYINSLVRDFGNKWTNLFNTTNILKADISELRSQIDDDFSQETTKKLIASLGVRYIKKEALANKPKKNDTSNANINNLFNLNRTEGNYGSGETKDRALPTLDELLK